MGPIETSLRARLLAGLRPQRLALENESHRHSVPPGSESHWNAVIVADAFAGLSRVARQRKVFEVLGDLMPQIHALTLKTMTFEEWQAAGGDLSNPAPPCMGGGKHVD